MDTETSLDDRIAFMARTFPKGSLVKFCGTANIVWCALPVEDKRNTVKIFEISNPRTLLIGLITCDPYERKNDVYITISSAQGLFRMSWITANAVVGM